MIRPLSAGAAGWIEHKISNYVEDYLSTRSPHTVGNIFVTRFTTEFFGFGEYTRSRKEPDGGLIYGCYFAIEVGTSETYGNLLDDKDMWINGKAANVVILVCFTESPRFRNPDTWYTNIAGVRAEKIAMGRSLAETVETNIALGYYGPLEYKDHKWVGELSEAFIEVWRPGSHERFDLIQDGFELAHENLPATLNLKMSDFYLDDEWQAANVEDNIIPFDSRSFLNSVMSCMRVVAQDRLELYLHEKLGLH
ncbi:hypothetical protein V1517DRAFT_306655 [Lipomyces orientalis]|uniref:Uncharacterized protein n=1 Tax=Lipomyces orientalis TaxID=1233043 RepID=A0ACC3TSI5_9ASCO